VATVSVAIFFAAATAGAVRTAVVARPTRR
jgi:hypothetical protein